MSYREPYPAEMRLQQLLAGVTSDAVPDMNVRALSMDSRHVDEGALFLACHGSRGHGLDYARQAQAAGAAAVAWEPVEGLEPPSLDVPAVTVQQLSDRVGEIAARFYGHPSRELFVAGITGTDGKSSCAWLLAQACRELGQRCGYLGTLGYGFPEMLEGATHTTPDPVRLQYWLARMLASGAAAVAMEISSHALDQGRANAVAFDVALLTNLGRDHLDYHGDLDSYAAAKWRLFEMPGLPYAVINADDAVGRGWLKNLPASVEGMAFGLEEDIPELGMPYVRGMNVECSLQGIRLQVESSWGSGELNSPLLGRFNAANLLACLTVLLLRGEDFSDSLRALAKATAVPGRMEVVSVKHDQPLTVVDYAHTPQALEQALRAVHAHASGRVFCVFGCGGDRDRGKRPLMAQVAADLADFVIVTDDNPRHENPADIVNDIVSGLPAGSEHVVEHNRALAIEQALGMASAGDAVLIAGKGHEDYQLVGDEILSFDDRQVAAAALARGKAGGGLH